LSAAGRKNRRNEREHRKSCESFHGASLCTTRRVLKLCRFGRFFNGEKYPGPCGGPSARGNNERPRRGGVSYRSAMYLLGARALNGCEGSLVGVLASGAARRRLP
jgi:hypothetical protein